MIPIHVTNEKIDNQYHFNVIMDDTNYILSKQEENKEVSYDISYSGRFQNANIRVSLYEKEELTAYNQNYNQVDLNTYITNFLSEVTNNVYSVSSNPNQHTNLNLNFITNNFNYTGYKLVFELYSAEKRVGVIEKYFIVR